MPRQARIDIPGLLHHVIVRGIEKCPIFLDDQDREAFLSRLKPLLAETGTDCYAWALLDTHFHLLLQPHTASLSSVMRRLLTGYAVYFNLRHSRSGHLFQNRYKSIVCDGDLYLLELVRYIHLNPFRARIVRTLEGLDNYYWSGHLQLIGNTARELINEDKVLSFFSDRRKAARQQYRQFIIDGIDHSVAPELSGGGKRISQAVDPGLAECDLFDDRILGGGDFVERVLNLAGHTGRRQRTLADIVEQVANYFEVEADNLRKPSKERTVSRAKAVICYVAVRDEGLKGIEVSSELAFTPGAVSHAAKRGEQVLRKEKPLQRILGIKL
jgi:putative transposase